MERGVARTVALALMERAQEIADNPDLVGFVIVGVLESEHCVFAQAGGTLQGIGALELVKLALLEEPEDSDGVARITRHGSENN